MVKNIVLVNPNHSIRGIIIPPIGLGYLAKAIRRKTDWKVFILDALKDNLTFEETLEKIGSLEPSVVGFMVFSRDHTNVNNLINRLNETKPGIITVIGGPHPSAIPHIVMKKIQTLNYIITGEGENALPLLLRYVCEGNVGLENIHNLVWKKNEEIIINPREMEEDIDAFDMPAWDLIDPRKYPPSPHGAFSRKLPTAPIVVTRGCPYSCTYCGGYLVTGKKIRRRSVENVIKEIELLTNEYGVKEIHIEDDNFTFDKNYAMEFCRSVKRLDRKLSFACPNGVRLDTLDEELLKTMEEAGFYSFAVGVETASPRLLKILKRGVNIETITDKVSLIARVTHIRMTAFLLFGLPTETKEEIYSTMEFALRMPFQRADFVPLEPLPGTELYNELVREGRIDPELYDFDNLVSHRAPVELSEVPSEELRSLALSFNRRFYLRPRIALGIMGEVRNIRHFIALLKRVKEYFLP